MNSQLESSRSPRRPSRQMVRDHIVRMVLTRQYPPGKKLVQEELAKELRVSRGAVREAIFELKGLGLVDARDNRGGRIEPGCGQFLLEAFELRELFDGLVARRCCRRITRAQLQNLVEMAHESYRLRTTGENKEGAVLDRKLHLTLMEISGNSLQIQISRNFWFTTMAMRVDRPDLDRILSQHLEILAAIEKGDSDAAEAAARKHVRSSHQIAIDALERPSGELHWLIDPFGNVIESPDVESEAG